MTSLQSSMRIALIEKAETLSYFVFNFAIGNSSIPPPVEDTDDIVLEGELILCQDGKSRFLLFE